MTHDPRRDPNAQRQAQLASRGRPLYPVLEVQPEPEPEVEGSYDVGDEGDVVISAAMGQGRFFADEEQETTIPVEEWNEQHPLWLALKKGDVKIVRGPDGRDVMVTRDAYVRYNGYDQRPTQDYSKPDNAQMDQSASLAQIKYELAKTIIAYAACDFPLGTAPIVTRPVQASVAVPPIGGAVLCASLNFGHKGSEETVIFDLPGGQIVKAPFAGSFAKLSARLWPKYYTNQDTAGPPNLRQYLVTPTGPVLTSDLWNSVPSSLMANNGFTNPNPQPCKGWTAEGFLSNDDKNRPLRRFYGTVKCDGTIADWPTRCPIAFAATYVMLVGGTYDSASPTSQSLQFLQNLRPTSGIANPQIGPFDVNQIIALDANCTSIDVINSPHVVGAGPGIVETPFELIYFLSF